jgi:hypothetical protein
VLHNNIIQLNIIFSKAFIKKILSKLPNSLANSL